ncbi:hypothetical protein AKJ36_00405, partial [candidate division MSBL1 archaeon SCGC-AAA259I07]
EKTKKNASNLKITPYRGEKIKLLSPDLQSGKAGFYILYYFFRFKTKNQFSNQNLHLKIFLSKKTKED